VKNIILQAILLVAPPLIEERRGQDGFIRLFYSY
jgi:hypothetical protein